jgi:hypothetical protein
MAVRVIVEGVEGKKKRKEEAFVCDVWFLREAALRIKVLIILSGRPVTTLAARLKQW